MKNLLLILLLIPSLFLTNCKEEVEVPDPIAEEKLPPITSNGNNTLGCYVNGELFIAGRDKGKSWNTPFISVEIYRDSILDLLASDDRVNQSIHLGTIFYHGQDSVSLYNPNSNSYGHITNFINFNAEFGGKIYRMSHPDQGYLKIIRNDGYMISGTFEFHAINKESGDSIHITQGRFDVKR